MNRYSVIVTRTETRTTTIEVDAPNAKQARAVALADAGGVEFSSAPDADYDVESVILIGSPVN